LLFGSGPNNSMSEFETNAAGNVMLGHTSSKFKPSAQPADHVFDKLMKAATAGTGSEALLLDLAAESDLEGPHRQSRTQTELRSQFVRPCLHEGRLVGHPGVAELNERTWERARSRAEERRKRGVRGRGHGPGRGLPHNPRFKHSSRNSPSSAEHRALPSAEAIASSHSSSGRAHRQGQRSEPRAIGQGDGLLAVHHSRLLRDGSPTEAEPQLLRLPRHDRHQDLVHEPALDGQSDQHQAKAGGHPAQPSLTVDEGNAWTCTSTSSASSPATVPWNLTGDPRLLTTDAAATKP